MIEEHENQETSLQDLIDLVERDDLPTNEFTIQDKDPMVILGKLNEVIAYLQTLQATINASDSKANEALQKAIQAVDDAIEAVGTANTALSASNTALSTANTAISTANTALSSANDAVETAESAETKADTAITTANGAKTTAEGIDAKATTALANSQTAVSTANTAETKAQEALDQVVTGLGTKIYRGSQLLSSLDIKPIEDDITDNTTAITALQNEKVDKVTGKQLSTEDFTTAEKNKLAGLNNYDDTQIQADISSNTNEINALHDDITAVEGRVTTNESDIDKLKEGWISVGSASNIGGLLNIYHPEAKEFLIETHISGVEPNDFVLTSVVNYNSLSTNFITLSQGMFFSLQYYIGVYLRLTKTNLTINNYSINGGTYGTIKVYLYYR